MHLCTQFITVYCEIILNSTLNDNHINMLYKKLKKQNSYKIDILNYIEKIKISNIMYV